MPDHLALIFLGTFYIQIKLGLIKLQAISHAKENLKREQNIILCIISDKTQLIKNYFSSKQNKVVYLLKTLLINKLPNKSLEQDKSKFTNFWRRHKINVNYFVSIQNWNLKLCYSYCQIKNPNQETSGINT